MSEQDIQAGDREVILGQVETMRRNNLSTIQFSNDTRVIVRGLEEQVQSLKNMVIAQDNIMKNYQKQLAGLLQASVSGGS